MNTAVKLLSLNRLLLATYTIALLGLLMFPFSGSVYLTKGIGIDKLVHVVLFGGLTVFLQWNLAANRNAVWWSIAIACLVAVLTELAQALVPYRSAELADVAAGLVGAILAATSMRRIMSSGRFERYVGLIVGILGILVAGLFGFADLIGLTGNKMFGMLQVTGTALGALIAAGGFAAHLKRRPG